jgi:glutaredoxin
MKSAVVTIYSRPGCHLCDEAKANILASEFNRMFEIRDINIDDDQSLKEKFGADIPVVLINGIKVFKHRVQTNEFDLKLRRFINL